MTLTITPFDSYYEAGSNVTLSCNVAEPTPLVDINTTVYVMWMSHKSLLSQIFIQNLFNHTIENVKLSDAGEYNCTYYLTSATNNSYIIPSDVRTGVTNVTIKSKLMIIRLSYKYIFTLVPSANISSIRTTPLNRCSVVGNNINLVCSVTYPNSPLIDITTNVTIQWLNSSNHTLHSYTGINNYTEHTINYTINNVSLSNAGQYTCQYNVSSTNHSFVLDSDYVKDSINVSIKSKLLFACVAIRVFHPLSS